jgi:hypothetical protein
MRVRALYHLHNDQSLNYNCENKMLAEDDEPFIFNSSEIYCNDISIYFRRVQPGANPQTAL